MSHFVAVLLMLSAVLTGCWNLWGGEIILGTAVKYHGCFEL